MADQNFSMSNVNENKNIDVRTQNSDLGSIQQGVGAEPYNPPVEDKENTPTQAPTNQPAPQPTQPSNEINLNDFQMPVTETTSSPQPPSPAPKKKSKIVLPIIVFIVIVALGLLGYFVIYPLFAPKPNVSITTQPMPASETSTAPQNTLEANTPQTTENPTTTETSSELNASPNPSPSSSPTSSNSSSSQNSINHVSLLNGTNYVATSSLVITGKNLSSFALPSTTKPALIEITFTDPQINMGSILNELFGINLSQSGIAQSFDPTRTAEFIYLDANGKRWLGVIGKLATSNNLIDAKSSLSQMIESNVNLKNIFSSDPGTQGAWKNGDTIISPHRFTLFSKSGYSIDYGWKDNIFIISSSYDGLKLILSQLE